MTPVRINILEAVVASLPLPNPLELAFDRVFDVTLRQRYFKGLSFTEPSGDPGWFGPESAVWYVHEHLPALFLGLTAAAAIETLHPDFAWMGYDHTRAIERVDGVPTGKMSLPGLLERGGHSVSFFTAVAYGTTASADRAARTVRAMHKRVKGTRPDGQSYDANDPETLRWAYATVVWGIATAHERYHARPLRGERLDRYYREFVRVGEALGGTDLPASKADVRTYLEWSAPLMGVTGPCGAFFANLAPHNQPPAARPAMALLEWAILDLQPPWAKAMLRAKPTNRLEKRARRAAIWVAVNGLHYGTGGLREARHSRQRALASPGLVAVA
ncbi:MAG: oxygenase MpaB family protein [Acidimicrobiales bacterium]